MLYLITHTHTHTHAHAHRNTDKYPLSHTYMHAHTHSFNYAFFLCPLASYLTFYYAFVSYNIPIIIHTQIHAHTDRQVFMHIHTDMHTNTFTNPLLWYCLGSNENPREQFFTRYVSSLRCALRPPNLSLMLIILLIENSVVE